MIHQVILPKLGTNIEDGLIAEWRFRENDEVKKGDVLMLVETSKAIFEVEAESGGYLRKILFQEGQRVRFTEPVGLLSDRLEEEISAHIRAPQKTPKRHHEKKREELVEALGVQDQDDAPRKEAELEATPAARRMIRGLGLDVERIVREAGPSVVDEGVVREFLARKKVVVYGAGLGFKQVKEIVSKINGTLITGLFDDDPGIKGKAIAGHKVLGGLEELVAMAKQKGIDAIAVSLHSEHRRKVIEKVRVELPYLELAVLVDPRATVCQNVTVSPGALVEAGSTIGPDTFIGLGAIVDMGATVSHDCHIGAHSHLSPGCTLSGVVRLEENVLVGVGASLNSQINVGRNCVITPGSAVVSDIPDDVVVSGNPARVIGKSLRGT